MGQVVHADFNDPENHDRDNEVSRFQNETIPVISREEFVGDQRTLDALNAGLKRAWTQSNPVSRILAKVRCEIFQLAPREYAERMGDLSPSTLKHLEMHRDFASARYNPETIHRIISAWEAMASSGEYNHVEARVLESISELLSCLSSSAKTPIHGVLLRWRYRVGPSQFDSVTGLNYKQLWSRANAGMVPSFSELLDYGQRLSLIPLKESVAELEKNQFFAEVREAWTQESLRLGRERPLIDLHVAMGVGKLSLDIEALKEVGIKIQSRNVDQLRSFQMCPWSKVRAIPSFLRQKEIVSDGQVSELRSEWQAHWRARKPSFEDKLHKYLQASTLDTRRIADALGITTDDIYKPSLPVFRAVKYGEGSKWISLGVLAHILVPEAKEREPLLAQKREEILRARRLRGSNITSPVAIERELWSLKYEDLPYEKQSMQELEWGRPSSLDEAEVLVQVRRVGEEKAAQALSKLDSRNQAQSVSDLMKHLLFHHGIAKLERVLSTSQPRIQFIRDGLEVPTLPQLRDFAHKGSITLGDGFEDDWRRCNAKLGAVLASNPLERVLTAHMNEFFQTKKDLYEKTTPPNRIHRITHGMLDTGTLEQRDVSLVLKGFDVTAYPARAKFVREVLKSGSILEGIHGWLGAQDSDAVNRLRNMACTDVVGPRTKEESAQISSAVANVLRDLPGVTELELLSALRGERDPMELRYKRSIRELLKLGLSEEKLRYIAVGASDRERVPVGMIQLALQRQHSSPVLSLGVVTSLCHPDGSAREDALMRARAAVREVLFLEGTPTSELCIEKRLWGIRMSDIPGGWKALQAEVWKGPENTSCDVLKAVREIRDAKLATALARARYVTTARHSAEFLDIANQICLDSGNAPLRKAHLSFSQPGLIHSGTFQVCREQFEALGRLADGPEESVLELYWSFEAASNESYRGMPALKRILNAHILANHVSTGGVAGRANKLGRDALALKQFAKRGNLRVRDVNKLIDNALREHRVRIADWGALIDLCKIEPREKFTQLLQMSVTEQTLSHAVARWLWHNREDSGLVPGWQQLVERSSRYLARDKENHDHPVVLAEPALSDVEIGVMRLLRGVTADEIVHIGKAFENALQKRAVKTGKPAEPWHPTESDLAHNIAQRLELIGSKLQTGYTVSVEAVMYLLPELAAVTKELSIALKSDLPWFIASLSYYKDVNDALEVMLTRLKSGLVPKHSGMKHYELHRRWMAERGALGKLSPGSMGLYFGTKFVMPLAIEKSTRHSSA